MYIDTKEKFKTEFEELCSEILKRYPTKLGQEREIAGYIIIDYLNHITHDTSQLSFIEFYKKYLTGTMFLDCNDFTKTQIKEIIAEAPLNERDRILATMYWVDIKNEQDIANELNYDIRTIRNNIPKISQILKQTCAKIYK